LNGESSNGDNPDHHFDPSADGALPTWPYSSAWGYYPSSGLGLVLLIIIILVLMGRF